MILLLAIVAFLSAAIPCALFCLNLAEYQEPPQIPGTPAGGMLPAVSILIPARNEAKGIADAIRSALASSGVRLEVVVMDDHSSDSTASIVRELAERDRRVRLERSAPLPDGWNGKQHACWQLAQAARYPVLCFVDADVRLEPECVARMAKLLGSAGNSLVSGFPHQITETPLEWLLLPLIHFVLLGFLPLRAMRGGTSPAFAAGCGQFMMCRAEQYFQCGGHSKIRLTMHDGLLLPRLFRENGLRTDLADLTALAECRMYTSAAEVWNGLAKNATEGLAAPNRIGPITCLLLLGQIWPFVFFVPAVLLLYLAMFVGGSIPWLPLAGGVLIVAATLAAWLPRFLAAASFRQSGRSALLHPVGVLVLLGIQWYAFVRKAMGSPVSWRDRAYSSREAAESLPQTAAGGDGLSVHPTSTSSATH